MSISQSVSLSTPQYPGLEFFISKLNQNATSLSHKTNANGHREEFPVSYAVGMGYYYTGRCDNILDLILCMTNVNDTKFTIHANSTIAKKS